MENSRLEIKDMKFDDNTPKDLAESSFYNDWPVVYILNNDKEMYVGETYHASERMKQHRDKPERRKLTEAHIIGCKDFTKSSTLDIESSLIELIKAIPNNSHKLQNGNNGIVKHYYSNKEEFSQDSKLFTRLWSKLLERGLVTGGIENLKNTDLFKYSPYKSLTAEQCTVRDYILEDILEAFKNNKQQSIFVDGTAGTGKTILAIYLMKLLVTGGEFINDDDLSETMPFINDLKEIKERKSDLKIAYVVAMTSFRQTLKEVFRHIDGLKSSMIIGPNEVAKDNYDILIVDEAHRLMKRKNLTSYGSFDDVNRKLGLPCNKEENDGDQLDWIVKQSQIQILFYDSLQSVRPTDIDFMKFESLRKNSDMFKLTSQMRCKGGNNYSNYINNILNEKQEHKQEILNYEVLLFDDINDFSNKILEKENEIGLSRIVSGYGFEWVSKNDESLCDIDISNRKFIWNKSNEKWVLSIKGQQVVNEVGCIHTIQGYDLNYCGVIFGPEIIYRNGHIEINKDRYFDRNGKAGVDNAKLKEYIINIYSVLLTRGIKGTCIYVCDNKLREYLRTYFN